MRYLFPTLSVGNFATEQSTTLTSTSVLMYGIPKVRYTYATVAAAYCGGGCDLDRARICRYLTVSYLARSTLSLSHR